MSSEHSINIQSLNLVQDELIVTIENSARELESFVSSGHEDVDALQASINGVQQIAGILKMLELTSASMLAEELLHVANEIPPGASGSAFDKQLEVISNTFFILTRYLEYLQQVRYQVPVLLVPHINALRKLRGEAALPESQFQHISVPDTLAAPPVDKLDITDPAQLKAEFRRARHMYQIGLTGFLREKQVDKSLALMRRAVKRVHRLMGSEQPLAVLWWLADVIFESFMVVHMAPLEMRKFLCMRLERVFRQLVQVPDKAMSAAPPKGLLKEMLYLVVLSDSRTEGAKRLRAQCPSLSLPYTEQALQKEYAALYGPSSHTISSLSYVLQTEISSAKRTLENAATSDTSIVADLDSFVSVLNNIAEIFGVVGLGAAGKSLKEQVSVVETWTDESKITPQAMSNVANTLLYLESLIVDLRNADLSGDGEARATNEGERDAQIANHELSGAIKIVIEESLGGLSLTKRALNSFSDSNYDIGHIKNIVKTLNSIRGAMDLLLFDRVARILQRSVAFVEEVLLDQDPPAAIHEVLETFADVIISVEYYFDSANNRGDMDDTVLKVAEESLRALGYGVEDE